MMEVFLPTLKNNAIENDYKKYPASQTLEEKYY